MEAGLVEDRLVRPAGILGGCLLFGLIAGGWLLGRQIKETRLADRYVTVKGLVERTVKSDSAIWPVTFKETGNELQQVYAKSEEDRAAVLKFFKEQGIADAEITVGQIQVTDKQANEYGNNQGGPRYIVQQTVTVSSNDVDKIAKAGQKTAQLLQAGIIVVGGYGQGIRYVFNGLNALKPDMITEATKNARASADRFAADSGSEVGSIRSANQGVFSISAADGGSGVAPGEDGGGGGSSPDASIMKKVRVVATVDYYLVK
ncbi:MAG: SIMPL domain-containing protein [Acidobacteria bacterium]|nr:SIMPL domain-containing protein [Acidobacteriota bacterium]